MWTMKELKDKAKIGIKKNYVACVAVCFLIAVLAGGYSVSMSGVNSYNENNELKSDVVNIVKKENNLKVFNEFFGITEKHHEITNVVVNSVTHSYTYIFLVMHSITNMTKTFDPLINSIFIIIALIIIAVIFLVRNVLLVGESQFFIANSKNNKTKIMKIFAVFKEGNYQNIVVTMLKKYVYLFLWFFTIIGFIIKFYEYRMISYILADNPELKSKEIFKKSKEMMRGNKWKTFTLDLSFIGWFILTGLTLGIVGFLYVNPYYKATDTELYLRLNKKK